MESLLLDNERGQYPTNIGNCDDGTSDDQEQGEGLTLRLKNVRPRNEDEEQGEDDVGNDEYDHAQTEDDRPVKRLRFLMSDRNPSESMQEEGEAEGEIEGDGEEGGGEGIVSEDKSTANNSLRLVISREGGDSGGHRPQPTSSNHTMQKPQLRNRGSSSSQLDEVPASMRASRRGPAETAKIDRGTGARTGNRASTRASSSKSDHSELEEEEGEEEEDAPSYGAQDEDDDNDSDDDDDKPVADDEDSPSEESDDSVPRSSRRKSKTKAPTPTRSSSRKRSVVEPPTSASKRLSGRSRVSYAEADSDEESEENEDDDRVDMEDKDNRSESDTEANDAVNHTATRRSGRESAGRNKLYDVKVEQETAVIVKRESRGRVIPPPPLPVLPTRSRTQINQDNGRQRRLPAARTSSSSSSSSFSSSVHPIAAPVIKPLQHYRIDSDTKANMNLILTTIETADKQNLFAESVTDEEAPGYSEIVLNPMDLGTAKYVITY